MDLSTRNHTLAAEVQTPENTAARILVVDDEPMVCDAIKRILQVDKYPVETAGGAEEALAACRARKFDLAIVDYEMPGMKGDKLAAAMKALNPKQSIIMVTAYSESLRSGGDFPLAVDVVIGKPFDSKEFREKVHQLVTRT